MDLSLDAIRDRVRDGGSGAVDLVRDLIPVWATAPSGVWISAPDVDRLLSDASQLDRLDVSARADLPLFAVPIAVKDNIDVAGIPTTAGCPAFARTPTADAEVVARLRAAGALIVGKTNLDQFATGLTGTRTPYGVAPNVFASDLVSGGSSSGSAVAVALSLVSAALGTDTAGSGRVPAACNGIVGWKPAPGVWSNDGVVPACRSLDCVSVFATTVGDAAALASVIGDRPVSARRGPVRVAVADDESIASFHAETATAYRRRCEQLVVDGHELVAVDLAPWFEIGALLYEGPWLAERTVALGEFISAHRGDVVPVVRDLVLRGGSFDAVDTFRGFAERDRIAKLIDQWWNIADVLLLPTVDEIPTIAEALDDPLGTSRRLGRLTNAANLLGLAAVSMPCGFRTDGRPFGVTAFSPRARESLLAGFVGVELAGPWPSVPPYDVAVVGAHLSGLPLNDRLTTRGARLVSTTTTSDRYRLYRLHGGPLPRPALERVEHGGRPIAVEVWRLDAAGFAAVVAEIPPPLAIGAVELLDGTWVRGFVCEPIGLADADDITASGGWRAHLAEVATLT